VQLFGTVSNEVKKNLSAKVVRDQRIGIWIYGPRDIYEHKGSPQRRKIVNFITHPDSRESTKMSMNCFLVDLRKAWREREFYHAGEFTRAAIGEAGETTLTTSIWVSSRKARRI